MNLVILMCFVQFFLSSKGWNPLIYHLKLKSEILTTLVDNLTINYRPVVQCLFSQVDE